MTWADSHLKGSLISCADWGRWRRWEGAQDKGQGWGWGQLSGMDWGLVRFQRHFEG